MKELLLWEEEESYRDEDSADDAGTDAEADALAAKRERLHERARKEVGWFFGTLGGRVPEDGTARPRALVIDGHLKAIPAFHRGALALCFTPRTWPPSLVKRYGKWTSLVVRLDCVLHPSGGGKTTEELEKAAVERLEEDLDDGDELWSRAETHEQLAIRAYVKVRGAGTLVRRIPARGGRS